MLLYLLWTIKIQKLQKQFQELKLDEIPSFKMLFLTNGTKNYTKTEDQIVLNYKDLHVWALV